METKEYTEPHRKVVVVGAGSVGATYCYALAQSGLASEIVLIDRNEDLALIKITGSILRDQNSVLTVSTYLDGEYGIKDVCLSVPCVVSVRGIQRIIDTPLASDEQVSLMHSADILRKSIDLLKQ